MKGLSYRGKPLAYMPFVYEHPTYWKKVEEETKGSGDIERSACLFIDSEKDREHTEEEMIKVENIKGKLILIGADDDSFWEAGKYVRRMDQRLQQHPHECEATRKDVDKRHSRRCMSGLRYNVRGTRCLPDYKRLDSSVTTEV